MAFPPYLLLSPPFLSFQMIARDSWMNKGHGYRPIWKNRDRAIREKGGQMKAEERVGRPWNVQSSFQGQFMPWLINDYPSYLLHSLIWKDDGYGADICSLLMLLLETPSLFLHFICHSKLTVSIRAPVWLTDTPRIPFPLSRGRCLSVRRALYVADKRSHF